MKYWSKSALSIYKYLETMSNNIDKTIMDTGKTSNSSTLQKYQTTYYQANKIIELIDRKRKMINLKVAVEDALCKVSRTSRRILTLSFIDGVTSELISQLLGVSLRTFFRKKCLALLEFTTSLIENGYDKEYFNSEYVSEMWLTSIYNECILKGVVEEDIIDNLIIKKILNEVSKITFAYNTYI